MALSIGTRLGPYEILAPLGAGGMGEVYKAKDTRLDRIVAVKILPAHLAAQPESRQRFEREARAISQLNHPHICVLHDIGCDNGIDFLVLEYLEGQTLAVRLQAGPLPLPEALRFAIQIADALDKAHRQGVTHRDLKPGNIMLTKSGAKLLDFGLAKFGPVIDTLTAASLTNQGAVLGTVAYMSPEQFAGQEADARSDLFSFGAVLYEMVTGKRAFHPPLASDLDPLSPPALDHLVQTCLARDPDQRWQSAADLRTQLTWLTTAASVPPTPIIHHPSPTPWLLAAVATLAAVVLAVILLRRPAAELRAVRSFVPPPSKASFDAMGPLAAPVALSPDGRRLVFAANAADGKRLLWVRALDAVVPQPLSGTEGAHYPFWSPDSRWIAFFAGGKLRRMEATGGPTQVICDAEEGRGGTWNREDVIVFSPYFTNPLYRVTAHGGPPAAVTRLDTSRQESNHRWPQFLPDGRHFVFTAMQPGVNLESESFGIYVASLDSPQPVLLTRALSNAVYASGYLLYARQGNLLAHPFDPDRRRFTGDPFPIAEQLQLWASGVRATFAVSDNGVLAYMGGSPTASRLLWFDRDGRQSSALGEPANFGSLSLSRDGLHLAVEVLDQQGGNQIWLSESSRDVRTRFTANFVHARPSWSPDASQVAFASTRKGQFDVYRKSLSGGDEGPLIQSPWQKYPDSWSPDGRWLVYEVLNPQTRWDLWAQPLTGDAKPFAVSETDSEERYAQISPSGRWIAYDSNESGRYEVYLSAFPGPAGAKRRVSTAGGSYARWRADSRELFYLSLDNQIMAVEIGDNIGTPRVLFPTRAARVPFPYDVSPDGKRFLVNSLEQDSNPLTLVLNWTADLRR